VNARATVWILLGILLGHQLANGEERLPRENLLIFRNTDGTIAQAASASDWEFRRSEILAGMQTVMGRLPTGITNDLKPLVHEEADCGNHVRRLITYESEPGMPVPAYLCIPKSVLEDNKKAPAVLCLHPTENRIGHKVVVGLGGKENRQYAQELAEAGFVTLSPSYPLLANYQPDLKRSICASGTMKAVHDNRRGLDYLESLPFVDSRKGFGAIGHSLGGHNAIYTAVFDGRIRVIVSSCGFDSYLDYYDGAERVWFHGKGWCQDRYMAKLADYRGRLREIPFDFHEMLGALAPRHVFVNAPLNDGNFRWQSVDRVTKAASQIYELFGTPDHIHIRHPDCGHDFPPPIRLQAYGLLEEVLR
jgi:hypothetical protein